MDATALARSLLEPVPAHRTAGIQVLRAVDCAAEVALDTPYGLTNVIGSLHSSGLIALLDAAGLAAVVAAVEAPGSSTAWCRSGPRRRSSSSPPRAAGWWPPARWARPRGALREVLSGAGDRARLATVAEISDATGAVVCRGGFDWSVRRVSRA